MTARKAIQKIIELDEKIAALTEEFETFPPKNQEQVLYDYFTEALEKLGTDDPVPIGTVRVVEMLLRQESDRMAKVLSDGLGHPNPDMRLLSGDALLHVAEDGLERIMPAVEEALQKGGLRAEEIPFLLTVVNHPEVPRVIERFLDQDDSEVVASAIEALADLGNPASVSALENLVADERIVVVETDGADSEECTIGQLAKDGIEAIVEENN